MEEGCLRVVGQPFFVSAVAPLDIPARQKRIYLLLRPTYSYLCLHAEDEDYCFGACPSLPRWAGCDHGDHGPHFHAPRRRGGRQNLHPAISVAVFPGKEPDGRDARAGRSADRPLRRCGRSLQLAARGAPHPARTSRFRAREILDAFHGALLRDDRPHRPSQRTHAGAVSDRQRRAA